MKKLLLSLGAITSAVAPVAAVVACGEKEQPKSNLDILKIKFDAINHTLLSNDAVAKLKAHVGHNTKFVESIATTQAATLTGRTVSKMLLPKGHEFHGTKRYMFLLKGGEKTSDVKQWGGSTLKAVYGADNTDANITGYISYVTDMKDHLIKISTGIVRTGTTNEFAKSNDIVLFEDKGALTEADKSNTYFHDVANRDIYGGIIWTVPTDATNHNAPSAINSGLGGAEVTFSDANPITAYHRTSIANVFIKM